MNDLKEKLDEIIDDYLNGERYEDKYNKIREEIMDVTKKALEKDPENLEILELKADTLQELGYYGYAHDTYMEILKIKPRNDRIRLKNADAYLGMRWFGEAEEVYDRIINKKRKSEYRDEALIAKLMLNLRVMDKNGYDKTMKKCKKIISEEDDTEFLESEIKDIEKYFYDDVF